jgi:hypothetical protein
MKTITINNSWNQVKKTLSVMNSFRDQYKADPDFVELARKIVRDAGATSPQDEAEAVRRWVRSFIEFRLDPEGVEYLQDPIYLLTESRCGDCDDQACLAAVLLACIGHEAMSCGIRWVGEPSVSHAVCWDRYAGLIVDPVSSLPVDMWPGPGYAVQEYVMGGH